MVPRDCHVSGDEPLPEHLVIRPSNLGRPVTVFIFMSQVPAQSAFFYKNERGLDKKRGLGSQMRPQEYFTVLWVENVLYFYLRWWFWGKKSLAVLSAKNKLGNFKLCPEYNKDLETETSRDFLSEGTERMPVPVGGGQGVPAFHDPALFLRSL